MAKPDLTDKQARFCKEYILDFNATQAAKRAGYSAKTCNEQGARLLANVSIQRYINKLTAKVEKKLDLNKEDIIKDLLLIKDRCMQNAQVLDKEGNPTGEYVFKEQGALKALELLGKHLAMFTENVNNTNTYEPIIIEMKDSGKTLIVGSKNEILDEKNQIKQLEQSEDK